MWICDIVAFFPWDVLKRIRVDFFFFCVCKYSHTDKLEFLEIHTFVDFRTTSNGNDAVGSSTVIIPPGDIFANDEQTGK